MQITTVQITNSLVHYGPSICNRTSMDNLELEEFTLDETMGLNHILFLTFYIINTTQD